MTSKHKKRKKYKRDQKVNNKGRKVVKIFKALEWFCILTLIDLIREILQELFLNWVF